MLSRQQIEQYHETGYLVVENVFRPELFSEIRQVVAEIADGAAQVDTHTDVYDLEPGHTRATPRLRRIKTPHKHHEIFMRAARAPEMAAICTQLLGPSGVRLYGSKINLKSPRYGSPVEWHQDWAFYPHTNDDLAAVGVMLDDMTPDNGPMLMLPGSHKGPVYDHHANGYFVGGIDPVREKLDFEGAQPCLGKAGSITIHHVRLVHGSASNLSALQRRFLILQYRAADAWPLLWAPLDFAEYTALLVSGEETVAPRMENIPVRLRYPSKPNQWSIYENQRELENTYFSKK